MTKIAWYTAVVLATLTVLVIIWQFSEGIVLFLLSFSLAAAFRPLIEELMNRGFKRGLALVITYAIFLITLAALIMIGKGPIIADLQNATDDLVNRYEWLKNFWLQGENNLLANLAGQMPPTQALYTSLTRDGSGTVINTILGFAQGTFAAVARVAMVVALSMYWSADQVRFERLWLSLLDIHTRVEVRKIWQSVENGVGSYIRREVTLSLLAGLLLWLVYLSLDIRYPTLLALIGALARLVPWLGIFLVILLPLMVGSTQGYLAAIAAAAASFTVLLLVEKILGRKLFPSPRTNSILLIIVVIALADSFGLMGALLATVLTVALQIIMKNLVKMPAEKNPILEPYNVEMLQERVTQIKSGGGEEKSAAGSETNSLVERLEKIMQEVVLLEKSE